MGVEKSAERACCSATSEANRIAKEVGIRSENYCGGWGWGEGVRKYKCVRISSKVIIQSHLSDCYGGEDVLEVKEKVGNGMQDVW
jgi:hypothetical protein